MDNPDGANLQLLQDLGVKMGERHFSQEYPRTLFDQDRR
jgi:hypothetical protein